MKINKLLEQWTVEGIISADQRDRIIEFETEKNRVSRPRIILYAFIVLGAAVIGIGIVSLIAANWKNIPPYMKLANNLIILGAAAYGVYRTSSNEKKLYFDGALVVFSMLCLASIGLISQVFHTGGELHEALFLWLALILPVTMLSRGEFPVHLWTAAFIISLSLWASADNSFWGSSSEGQKTFNIIVYYVTLPFLCFVSGMILDAAAGSSGSVNLKKFSQAGIIWSVITGVFAAVLTDIVYSDASSSTVSMRVILPLVAFAGISALIAFVAKTFSKKEKIMIAVMAAFTSLMYLLSVGSTFSEIHNSLIIAGPLFLIIVFLIFAMLFISRDMTRLFNTVTMFIGIRFLIVYFQVLGDLAATGFGLIVSGMLIIGVSMLWFKKREAFGNFLGGLIK